MNILITNIQLTEGTGTEQVVRDLAHGLRARGHFVEIYCPKLGRFAERLSAEGLKIVRRPEAVSRAPDIIHGHHHRPTMEAIGAHPGARALFVCHDGAAPSDHPPAHPRLLRYVAVDANCRERIAPLVPAERLSVVGNWFDGSRFPPRSAALPARPRRALVFSNYAQPGGYADAILAACAAEGIACDLAGRRSGRPVDRPETILGDYDLIFAKGKCSFEAIASGAALIICHTHGCGPMVTTANAASCHAWNFGLRLAVHPPDAENFLREIRRYDAGDAARVSGWLRERAELGAGLDAYESLYAGLMGEPLPETAPGAGRLRLAWESARAGAARLLRRPAGK